MGNAGIILRVSGFNKEPFRTSVAVALFLLFLAAPLKASELDEGGEDPGFHVQCWSLGASLGRVEGLSGGLAELSGPDNSVIILEGTLSEYLTPYTSEELQLSLIFVNDFNLAQFAYGLRWSTAPFPKVFLRPWVGAYLTLNFLEDLRDIDPMSADDNSDGIGFGLAAAAGVTMRLSRSVALEVAFKGDQIFTAGWLDTGDFFAEEFRVRGAYLRLLYFLKN